MKKKDLIEKIDILEKSIEEYKNKTKIEKIKLIDYEIALFKSKMEYLGMLNVEVKVEAYRDCFSRTFSKNYNIKFNSFT